MRFFILTAGLLLAEAALADSPRRPFPHGQEDHAPPDDEAAEGADSLEQNQTAGPTPADERACTLHFPTWAKRQAAPETHPDRPRATTLQAQLMAKMLALTEEWPGSLKLNASTSVRRDRSGRSPSRTDRLSSSRCLSPPSPRLECWGPR